ncbi:MAG: hypothetical protein IPO32_04315 [Crocinitomicaceae bacterium]|nr:hypothetical protein [Crocinitomicaceae bacterium]
MLDFILHLSPGILIALAVIIFIGLIAQAALYAKANEPWVAALVPVWNVIIFVDVVGRPKWQSWIIMVPGIIIAAMILIYWPQLDGLFPVIDSETLVAGPWGTKSSFADATIPLTVIGIAAVPMIVFMMIIFTEICESFGQHKTSDKILAIIFNGAYILFAIALSPTAQYEAPWYKKKRGLPYTVPEDPRKIKAAQMAKAQAMAKAQGHGHYGKRK